MLSVIAGALAQLLRSPQAAALDLFWLILIYVLMVFSLQLIHSWLLPPARSANGSAIIGVWDMQALTFMSASVCLQKCATVRTKQINRPSARAGPARKTWLCSRVCEQMQCPTVTLRLHFQIFSSERDTGGHKREKILLAYCKIFIHAGCRTFAGPKMSVRCLRYFGSFYKSTYFSNTKMSSLVCENRLKATSQGSF